MKKKGFTSAEILLAIIILAILIAIAIHVFIKPEIQVYFGETNGKKTLVYVAIDQYGYKRLYFRDVGLDGTLDMVEDSDSGLISDSNTIIRSAPSDRVVSWSVWLTRFEQEIRPKVVGN